MALMVRTHTACKRARRGRKIILKLKIYRGRKHKPSKGNLEWPYGFTMQYRY